MSKQVRQFRAVLCCMVALLAFAATASRAAAQEHVRIGVGYGLAFLPIYICEDLKLVEKQARQAHVDVRVNYERFAGAGPIEEALASGTIAMGPFGIAPLLHAWQDADHSSQVLAVSGISTMPLVLLSNQADERSLADLKPTDRIAIPTASSPQSYFLEMQAEKIFGDYDRLRRQVMVLSHAEAIAALVGGDSVVTSYFSSAPFTEIALSAAKLHPLLSSEDVIGGKASFLVMGATRAFITTHPKIPDLIDKAMDEAARLIHDDPRRAAQIYLAHEPSKALDAAVIEAVLRKNANEFGSAIQGVEAFAQFMARHDELKRPPQSWKEIVAPALLNSPSS